MSSIEELRNLDLKSSNPDIVRRILNEFAILCVPFYIKKGVYILRARKGNGFVKRKDMTYCPVEKCTSLQRATLAGQTMFYGVISDNQSHQDHARAIAVSECSSLCKEGIDSTGREYFTVAHWEVVKQLHVVSLITDKTFPNITENIILNCLRDAFVLLHGDSKSSEEEKEIAQFVSDEFSKPVKADENYKYLISATIATDIINDMDFDGIVFPSVRLGGQGGLNIALTPKAVNKKMRFIRTLDHTLFKKQDQTFLRMERVTEKGRKRRIDQFSDEFIIQRFGIKTLQELPIV